MQLHNNQIASIASLFIENQLKNTFDKVETRYNEDANTIFVNVKRKNLIYACISNSKEWKDFVTSLVNWNKTTCKIIHDTYKTNMKVSVMVMNDIDESKAILSLLDGVVIIDCCESFENNMKMFNDITENK